MRVMSFAFEISSPIIAKRACKLLYRGLRIGLGTGYALHNVAADPVATAPGSDCYSAALLDRIARTCGLSLIHVNTAVGRVNEKVIRA